MHLDKGWMVAEELLKTYRFPNRDLPCEGCPFEAGPLRRTECGGGWMWLPRLLLEAGTVLREEEERMPQGDRMLPGLGAGPAAPCCPP